MQSDAELVAQIATPEKDRAFELIVQRHGPFVYRVCLHLLRNPVDAEDAAQAVFLVLLRRAESLSKIDSLPAWLHGVARRVAQEARRSGARREQRQENAAVMLTHVVEEKPAAENAELWSAIHRELDALSTAQRQAIILRYLEGHSREDAARVAGCSPEALSNRASEGIAKLRERLARGGFELQAGALVLVLEKDSALGVPAALTSGLTAGKASSAASSLAQATLKAMLKAKVALMSMYASCALVLLIASFGAYRVTAGETKDPAPPPAPAPVAAAPAFVPKGGKIVLDLPLPARAPQLSHIKWSLDGSRLLAVVDRAWYDNKSGRGRQGDYSLEVHIIDAEKKSSEKLLSEVQNIPEWLVGGRLLINVEGKLWVYEQAGRGERREIPGKDWFSYKVSPDGRYVAFITGPRGATVVGLPLMLYDVETTKLIQLPSPIRDAAGGGELRMRMGYWTNDGKLCIGTAFHDAAAKTHTPWTRFFYDPATREYAGTVLYESDFFLNRSTRAEGRIMLSDMSWLTVVTETKRPEPSAAPKGDDLNPGMRAAPGVPMRPIEILKCGPTTALRKIDAYGKNALKEVKLKSEQFAHADLQLQSVSSDQRYAFCLSFSKRHLYSPMGEIHEYDGGFVIDLETGEALKVNDEGIPLKHSRSAVMSASREVLLFSWKDGQPGIWALPFDGSKPKNWSLEFGIKHWQEDLLLQADFGQMDRMGGNDVTDYDRTGVVVMDRDWKHVQDPRYETNPWMLMAFFNSARPIRIYVSKEGRADRPENLAWRPDGMRLAFTGGARLMVWEPTKEPGEAPAPADAGAKEGDF